MWLPRLGCASPPLRHLARVRIRFSFLLFIPMFHCYILLFFHQDSSTVVVDWVEPSSAPQFSSQFSSLTRFSLYHRLKPAAARVRHHIPLAAFPTGLFKIIFLNASPVILLQQRLCSSQTVRFITFIKLFLLRAFLYFF